MMLSVRLLEFPTLGALLILVVIAETIAALSRQNQDQTSRQLADFDTTTTSLDRLNDSIQGQARGQPHEPATIAGPGSTSQRIVPMRIKDRRKPETLTTNCLARRNAADTDHVYQCTADGKFEPVQCHKIGYCWCVNKYGQAIKNSATLAGQRPQCDLSHYESESSDVIVVSGVSERRIKNLLKYGNTSMPTINDESDSAGGDSEEHPEHEFNRRVSASKEPSLSLAPNECLMSRTHAKERAAKHSDESIWVPECDPINGQLYALKQCHRGAVCWCVDQVTGLPLRSREPLRSHPNINCTAMALDAIADSKRQAAKIHESSPVYSGFSEYCDADKRAEFIRYLIGQFRRQIGDAVKNTPERLRELELQRLSESQISELKFSILDTNSDGHLDDREWTKFKGNFKLVDRFEQRNEHPASVAGHPPLTILRGQRRCWRDFLEFCSNGDLLNYELVDLPRWLNCTDLPLTSALSARGESTHAHTREAAIARSKKKNPFLGILKPD